MRHKIRKHKLNRFTSWNEATLKSLARSILKYQSIKTTLHRAKLARTQVEKLINLTKDNSISAKREAFRVLQDHKLVSILFKDIGPLFSNRKSGFTRIIHLVNRRGDNAQMVIFELTEKKVKEIKKEKKAKENKVEATSPETTKEVPSTEKKEETSSTRERHDLKGKPSKKFLGGIRNIFKKERDSL